MMKKYIVAMFANINQHFEKNNSNEDKLKKLRLSIKQINNKLFAVLWGVIAPLQLQ
jgi:hypothetical protein